MSTDRKGAMIDHYYGRPDEDDIPTLGSTPVGAPITSNPLTPLGADANTQPVGGTSSTSSVETAPAIQRDENTLTSHTIPVKK